MNDEQLLLEWFLSEEDIDFVINSSRGFSNRLKYAVQICSLRQTGRFISKWEEISIEILNHLSKQLELELSYNRLNSAHKSGETRIRKEIKWYLGFSDFNFKDDALVSDFLEQNPLLFSNKQEIAQEVENFLIKAKMHLPSKNQLMKHVYRKYGGTQEKILEKFASKITSIQRSTLDEIYKNNILLPEIKRPMGEMNVKNISLKIDIIEYLLKLGLEELPWELIHPGYAEKLTLLIHKYDITSIRKISPNSKRDVMLLSYLYESSKSIIDLIVNSYDKLMGEIERRVNRDYDIQLKKVRSKASASRYKAIESLKLLRDHQHRSKVTLEEFCTELQLMNTDLNEIIINCEKVDHFEIYGKTLLVQRRYSYLTNFIQRFLGLEFKSSIGSELLMSGLEDYRQYHKNRNHKINSNSPITFIDNPWRKGVYEESGKFNRKAWELGLCFAVKKGLRTGNLYLPQSRYYRDFWEPLHNPIQWKKEKAKHYKELNAPFTVSVLQKRFILAY